MHVARQAVEAIKTVLNAGSPVTYRGAYSTRVIDPRLPMPFLSVFIEGETITPQDIHPGYLQEREVNVLVVGRSRLLDDLEQMDDNLAAMQAEIETTVTTAAVKAQLTGVKLVSFTSAEHDITEDDNEKVFAELTLSLQVRIFTTEGSPETLI